MESDLLTEQVETMAEEGWGAAFIRSRYGLTVEYMSDEWFEKVRHSVEAALDTGIDPWLYDEYLSSSGYESGNIPAMGPEYRIKILALRESPRPADDVLAVHETDDGLRYLCRTVPEASEYSTASGDLYTDLMNPDVIKEFLRGTYDAYADAVGEHFGDGIPGVFTDEPKIGFPGTLDDDALASVPWTTGLPSVFRDEYGYDLPEHLPSLFFEVDVDGRDYRTVRYDFWRLISTRFAENYTGRLAEWCEVRGLQLVGHYLFEDTIATQIPANGAVMPHYEYEHMHGMDFLGRFIGGNGTAIATKQASSAARQFDRTIMSELYGCSGQQFPFRVRKWLGD